MLLQSSQLAHGRVISLHTGQQVASLTNPILSPHKLEVVGFYCEDGRGQKTALLSQDIREAAPGKVLIDSEDEITAVGELIRLQGVIDINFTLIGKLVKSVSKKRLGKVEEYIIDTLNFEIQKLYVKQSLLKSFAMQSLVIDRQQIVEVSDKFITVEDAIIVKPAVATAPPATPAID